MQNTAHYPSLSGQGIFITGGATGIGAAMVRAFCAQGAQVTFADLNTTAATELYLVVRSALLYCLLLQYRDRVSERVTQWLRRDALDLKQVA